MRAAEFYPIAIVGGSWNVFGLPAGRIPTQEEFLAYFAGQNGVYYVPPCTYPGDPYGGLERYWREGFLLMFWDWHQPATGHTWSLRPAAELPSSTGNDWPWHQVVHRAKVRFHCQQSGHGWTSMNGHVAFVFRLKREGPCLAGEVVFKLYGQQCNRCAEKSQNEDGVLFETPLWYPEEIYRALDHLRLRVGETYYGYRRVAKVLQGIRAGKPKHPHLPAKCQACKDGICRARLN